MKHARLLGLCVICSWACSGSVRPAPPVVAPANLVDMAQVRWDFAWRQSISATYVRPDRDGRSESATFEAVLQKEGGILTMVGLTPFGTRAFVIQQEGSVVKLAAGQASQLPFPAEFIFLDVNRCFFMGLSTAVLADGWHQQQFHGETIQDHWRAGRLLQRIFRPTGASAKAAVVIRYRPGLVRGVAPSEVELVNERYSYSLKIRLLDAEAP